ncbi:MAG: cytidine deaminase [Verrucomicrobiota bacterium]|nr:cytidine deaminase [Verrucomicrobiota bacterium]
MSRDLIEIASAARERAYARYSGFKVGAALRCVSGEIFVGCNVENVSLGLTICAERSAVVAAVAAGFTRFEEIAIVADSQKPIVPCGACRQFLSEFGENLIVHSATTTGAVARFSLHEIFPRSRQGLSRGNK